ncbi:MAG: mechanosensitive ion channel [Gammaproteobacteria bacterium]|nr:mechanosensitive ion channel [Gammaproteobacteria bacterium]
MLRSMRLRGHERLFLSALLFVIAFWACSFAEGVAAQGPSGAGLLPGAPAAGGGATNPPDANRIDAIIAELEDPAARQQLIEKLRLLQQAQQPDAAQHGGQAAETPVAVLQTATSTVLEQVTAKVALVGRVVVDVVGSVNALPNIVGWATEQMLVPTKRQLWLEVLANLALVLGLGYVGYWLSALLLRRIRRGRGDALTRSVALRVMRSTGTLLLDLLPVLAFAGVAYATMSLLGLRYSTRLVAVAWVNAALIVSLVLVVGRFLYAPDHPGRRLLPVSDETAQYLHIWLKRLTRTAIYGYFALQAGLVLGLPWAAYEGLLRLFGLIVALQLVVLIFQNREPVAEVIGGDRGDGGGESGQRPGDDEQVAVEARDEETIEPARVGQIRQRLAGAWHLLAALYVLVLYGIWALDVTGGFYYMLRATVLSLAIIVIARGVLGLLSRAIDHPLHMKRDLNRRFPGLEARANRYLPIVHSGLRLLVMILALLAILEAWGTGALAWLASEPGRYLGARLGTIVMVVVGAVVVWEGASALIESYLAETDGRGRRRTRSARVRTLLSVARNALLTLVSVVATLLVLSELGINIAPLLAGAGVVGLAIGFGAQTLVKDFITGAIILFQDLISVGDVVTVSGISGLVEAVSIRHVRLRDLSGTVHTIPFSSITTVSNLTKDFSYYVMDIGVAYREDVDEVMQVLGDIGRELRADRVYGREILDDLEILGVDGFADSAVMIKARIKTRPIQQWMVGREFNRRMKRRFDELGIEIPYPHQTVYFGTDKDGHAAPARLRVEAADSRSESEPLGRLVDG